MTLRHLPPCSLHPLQRAMARACAIVGMAALLLAALATRAAEPAPAPVTASSFSGFNPAMLSGTDKIDVSRFARSNVLFPGKYRADLYVNQEWLGRRDIDVTKQAGSDDAQPCITKALLLQAGLNVAALPTSAANARLGAPDSDPNACVDMASQIPNASVVFDAADLRLDVSIPQVYLSHQSRGYVDPSEWQQGINAGFLSYSVNSTQTSSPQPTSTLFAGLNFGLNLQGWRLRYNGSYTDQPGAGASGNSGSAQGVTDTVQQTSRWQLINAYAQHDLISLQSQLTIGDAYTNGDMFNSVAMQGVMLASDDRMLPESQRGYAPVIRGVAETNARVTVRQGGNVIYETTVPPGEFRIDDMYNSSFAGDFFVTIIETDGRQKQFVVPYSNGVLLLRPGQSRYSAAVGKLLNVVSDNAPVFGEATYQRGVGQGVTLYGGAIAGNYYGSLLVGSALSTQYGSFGVDLTRSAAKTLPDEDTLIGRSWRLNYSKVLQDTGTNFSMAAYRYSTSDFLTLTDAALIRSERDVPGPAAPFLSPKKSFQLSLTQPLAEGYGSLFVSGIAQYYWNEAPNSTSYQAGYTNNASWGNWGVSLSRTADAFGVYHNLTSFNINVPIGREGSLHRPNLTASVSTGDHQTNSALAVNGNWDDNGKINYNAYDNYASSGNAPGTGASASNTVGLGAQYAGAYGQVWGSYSSGATRQGTFNVSGAVLAFGDGVILAPSLGETIAIVQAPGMEGATVMNSNHNRIDASGYSVIPFLNPFINNDVVIDPKGSNMDAELDTTSVQVAPRAGAIVLLKFTTTIGRAVLVTLTRSDGNTLPIGSTVVDEHGKDIGMLAQGGRFFYRGLGKQGVLHVRWGDRADQQCVADYTMPDAGGHAGDEPYERQTLACHLQDTVAGAAPQHQR